MAFGRQASRRVVLAVKSESIAIPVRAILPVLPRLRPLQAKPKTSGRRAGPKRRAPTGVRATEAGKGDQDEDRAEARVAGHANHGGRGERVW